jgi:hypothetical protein
MSRRTIALLALALVSPSLVGCADAVTAPARPTIAPAAAPTLETGDLTTCRGGWVSSTGRCE